MVLGLLFWVCCQQGECRMISDIDSSSNVTKITTAYSNSCPSNNQRILDSHAALHVLFAWYRFGIFIPGVAVLEDTAMFKNVDSKILCLGLTVRILYCIKIILLDLFFSPVTYTPFFGRYLHGCSDSSTQLIVSKKHHKPLFCWFLLFSLSNLTVF